MSTRIANIISIVGIILLGAYVAWMYPGLPDPMPTHWNAAGEVDDYTAKAIGAPLIAAIPIFSFVIFKLIPVVSPRGFRTESFRGTLNILMTATVVFGCVIGVGVMRAAQDASVDISSFVFVATPWTLASDEVWAKTHRMGGWCFVIAGAFMAIMGVATPPSGMPWVIAVIVAIALVPVVYSYIAYRRIEGFAPDPDIEE